MCAAHDRRRICLSDLLLDEIAVPSPGRRLGGLDVRAEGDVVVRERDHVD
jgi:hypothetical protein